jgi:hypothetical protein
MVLAESRNANHSSKMLTLFAWLFVGIPLAWGVYQTGYQSLGLFRAAPGATAPATMPH